MKSILTTFIAVSLPFFSFLQISGTLSLYGDADYYDYDKSQFAVYYGDELLGNFDSNGSFEYSSEQKGPLIIKHPDFVPFLVEDLSFSKRHSTKVIDLSINETGRQKLRDKLKSEELSTCTGSNKAEIIKSTEGIKFDSEALFPGDTVGSRKQFIIYTAQQIRYPQICVENGIQGKVYFSVIVEADGSVTCIEIKKGADYWLDKEALRFVKGLPKLIPAMVNGEAVPSILLFPVSFKLN